MFWEFLDWLYCNTITTQLAVFGNARGLYFAGYVDGYEWTEAEIQRDLIDTEQAIGTTCLATFGRN